MFENGAGLGAWTKTDEEAAKPHTQTENALFKQLNYQIGNASGPVATRPTTRWREYQSVDSFASLVTSYIQLLIDLPPDAHVGGDGEIYHLQSSSCMMSLPNFAFVPLAPPPAFS